MNTYEKYKDSGVEWIGEIPSHWEIIKTNLITTNLDGKRIPLNSEERGDIQGEVPYWGSNGVVDFINTHLFDDELVLVGEDGSPFFDRFKPVSFYVSGRVWINNHIHVLKTKECIHPKFLTHTFNNVEYREFITGSTRDKLTQSDLNRIPHPLPPLTEQHQIVSFLDEKTSLIDDLINKKEQKIGLLKEYRTSLINRVVTKGLNPDCPMKDSGVEWIGEIPSHWTRLLFKHHIDILTDFTANGSFASLAENVVYREYESYSRLVRLTDLRESFHNDGIYVDESAHTYLSKTSITGGEILLANVGAYAGLVWQVPPIDFVATLGPNMFLLKFDDRVVGRFVYWLLSSDVANKYLTMIATSTAQPKLNKDNIRSLPVVVPPLSEQEQIVSVLDDKTGEIDRTIQSEKKKIELLKEYRQSLISSVITGKIKVVN